MDTACPILDLDPDRLEDSPKPREPRGSRVGETVRDAGEAASMGASVMISVAQTSTQDGVSDPRDSCCVREDNLLTSRHGLSREIER